MIGGPVAQEFSIKLASMGGSEQFHRTSFVRSSMRFYLRSESVKPELRAL